tara:strand:- start:234 stop:446 length:213 start_codon:yes stop_codon:yes gene_type:complete
MMAKAKWKFISTLKGLGHLGFGLEHFQHGPAFRTGRGGPRNIVRFPGRPGVKWVRKKGTRRYYARKRRKR